MTSALTRSGRRPGMSRVVISPVCPDAVAPDRSAARVVASHPEQGWSLLCNGVLLLDDGGELLPVPSGVVVTAAA